MGQSTSTSPERDTAAQALVQLRTRVGSHFDEALVRSPQAYACKAGCAGCCHHESDLTVFEVEAARIRVGLAELERSAPELRDALRANALRVIQGPTAAGTTARACALLMDGRCAIYDERPLICRSHGLPTLVQQDADKGPRIENCALNFAEASGEASEVPRESVLDPERLNAPLAIIASMWTGSRDGQRISLRALVADSPNG